MFNSIKGYWSRPIVLWVIFLLLLFFMISKPTVGFPESTPAGLTRTALVKIYGKTYDTILISERHFKLTQKSTILDTHGNNIELGELPVPCLAEITYRLRMDQDPLVLNVVVKEVLPGSSTVYVPRR